MKLVKKLKNIESAVDFYNCKEEIINALEIKSKKKSKDKEE